MKVDEAKARAKIIIAYSIKDHRTPHVSSLETPKGSVQCYDEAIEEESDIVITTFNGLPRSCDSFIQKMRARRK